MFGTDDILFDFSGSCFRPLVSFSPLSKSPGQKRKKGHAEVLRRGVQQVDRRCTTRRLRIQKGTKGREGTKQDDLFDSWEEAFVGFCRRRLERLLSWF